MLLVMVFLQLNKIVVFLIVIALPSLGFVESRPPLAAARPKCNSILHLFGEWLFEAAHIGGDAWIQHTKSIYFLKNIKNLVKTNSKIENIPNRTSIRSKSSTIINDNGQSVKYFLISSV